MDTFPNTSFKQVSVPSRTLGTRSQSPDSGNVNGATKQHMTPSTATTSNNVSYATHGDTMKSIAKPPTATAKPDASVELATTTPTSTTLSATQTSKPLDEARDVNRGVMSQQ